MQPSGDQHSIAALGYTASISEVGASLRALHYRGRPLVAGFAVDQVRPVYRGALLAPWPNRVADGAYEFGGARHQLPLNEPVRQNALHGLVAWVPWTLLERSADQVVLGYRLFPQDGYPFRLDFTVTYVLSVDGLTIRLRAFNAGTVEAPYGCAPHPYLVAGDGKVDDWTLQLPGREYLEVTPDRLLPVRVRFVEGTDYDFRQPRQIGSTFIDHAFTGLEPDDDGRTRARLLSGDGHGVEISWDSACPWVQVHTADRPEPDLHRSGLAVEPMTCPPDAFNSRIDLVVLAPGESHQATWTITAV